MSVPQSNSAYTTDNPTPDVERTRVTPGMPLRAVSRGKVTSCSTSSGAMPPASVSTVTMGLLRSGKTSTGVRMAVNTPTAIEMKAPTSTNRRCCRLCLTIQLNMAASANLVGQGGALHHHPAVGRQPTRDQHALSIEGLSLNRLRRESLGADFHPHNRLVGRATHHRLGRQGNALLLLP